jgi:hypothetical protein
MPKVVNEDGEVWAVPVGQFGFCPAVVARRAEPADPVGFSLVYLWPVSSEDVPGVGALPPLPEWGMVWVGLVARRPFSTKRWMPVGSYPGFGHDEWPMPPWREAAVTSDAPDGWSVATTDELPSMTAIANDPVDRETAARFPPWQIVTAPSALEKGLVNYLKQSEGGFFDMVVEPLAVDAEAVRRWRDHGAEVRSRPDASEPEGLPAGRRTDQSLAGGEWLAFPATGGGFGVGLFLPRPPSHRRVFSDGLVLVFGRVWPAWPTLSEARELTIDQAVAVGQTSMICVRDGRWRVLGRDAPFDTERWPLPMWWTPSKAGDASIDISTPGGVLNVPLDRAIIEADPEAGSCWSGSGTSYSSLELFPAGRYASRYMLESHGVTATRIQTWRLVNQRIEAVLGRPAITLWLDE